LRRVFTKASMRSKSAALKSTGMQSSRKLQLEHATLKVCGLNEVIEPLR